MEKKMKRIGVLFVLFAHSLSNTRDGREGYGLRCVLGVRECLGSGTANPRIRRTEVTP